MGVLASQHAVVVPFVERGGWGRQMFWLEEALRAEPKRSVVVVGLSAPNFLHLQAHLGASFKERVFCVPSSRVFRSLRSAGMIEAMRQGLLWSFEQGAEVACSWDAVGEVSVEDLGAMLALLQKTDGVDHVMAARLRLLGRAIERSLAQLYFERVLATGISLAVEIAVYDTLCFSQAYLPTQSILEAFSRPFACVFLWQAEFLLRRKLAKEAESAQGQRTIEYPLRRWEGHGYSGLSARHLPQVLWEMGWLARRYRLEGVFG